MGNTCFTAKLLTFELRDHDAVRKEGQKTNPKKTSKKYPEKVCTWILKCIQFKHPETPEVCSFGCLNKLKPGRVILRLKKPRV